MAYEIPSKYLMRCPGCVRAEGGVVFGGVLKVACHIQTNEHMLTRFTSLYAGIDSVNPLRLSTLTQERSFANSFIR